MKPELAFLGPKGTYSHQAAYDRFGDTVEYAGKTTITDVYESVCSGESPIGVIPQENSIHGIVIETYDMLRGPDAGREAFVRGEVTIGIQHCLITRKGVALEDVRRVLSHEQALGQCGQFIRCHLKDAVLVKTASTVAAVETILADEENGYSSAAIASSMCEQLFDGVQVLQKGIQDEASNFTRFYILARSIDGRLPSVPNARNPCSWGRGLLRIAEPQRSDPLSGLANVSSRSSYRTRGVGLAGLLSVLDLQIYRLDRRPILGAKTFAHLYIVEVGDSDRTLGPANGSPVLPDSLGVIEVVGGCCGGATDLQLNKPFIQPEGGRAWALRLQEAVGRVEEAGGGAEVLGCW